MPEITFQTFLNQKDNIAWKQSLAWMRGVGAIRHLVWKGFFIEGGRVTDIPSYFAYITVDDDSGNIGIALSANVNFDIRGRGQKIIDKFTVGSQNDVSDPFLMDVMHQRYGLTELDFTKTPVAPRVGTGKWQENRQTAEKVLIRKTMYNPNDQLLAMIFLRKKTFLRGADQYQLNAVIVPTAAGLDSTQGKTRSHKSVATAKEGMDDFYSTLRQFRTAGFAKEMEVPAGANAATWDFDLGAPMEISRKIQKAFEDTLAESSPEDEYSSNDPVGDDINEFLQSSCSGFQKIAQAPNAYYQGPLPSADQLTQYVGTPSVDASQIKGIFGGVDEALSLVNQFDSSLMTNVTFIYNITGGNAYGVYMSGLDSQIKDAELKKLLKMDGYQIEDMPDGSFYATHKDKDKNQIDREISAYRQKVESSNITTFGIDMNKVIEAARSDATEGGITDQQDQYMLGVMHLGATMVHEAIHSKGSETEGPSEGAESKFMEWVMPIVNQRRQQRYQSEGREAEYAPLIIQSGARRMASSNWLAKAEADIGIQHTAQYGAQFLHNQEYVKRFGPAPWSAAYWSFGVGPVEAMLDNVRPVPKPSSQLSFEGQLRESQKNKWASGVDAGLSTEELLEIDRNPLEAYRSTESLMEDSRERPLMLPVKGAMVRTAWAGGSSYDRSDSKDAFGWMSNLDLPMGDRVQPWDNNDEETTWFDRKFIGNQPRYNPEYGNPMSKEDGFMSWWKDLNMEVQTFNTAMEERPNLKTSPWRRSANDHSAVKSFIALLDRALQGIVRGKIRGTRFMCPQHLVPFIKKFFEHDIDIRVDIFGEGPVAVWACGTSIPHNSIEACERYIRGDSDEDADRRTFEYVTSIGRVRSESISGMIAAVQRATRDAGVSMMVVGDLPLAIKTGAEWSVVRTVDFCSDDPDACIKIGEIACSEMRAEYQANSLSSRRGSIIVAHKGCVTFRFLGAEPLDATVEMATANGLEPTVINCELISRKLTPLMLAMDVVTEDIVDPTGEAIPDVEAKVVRAAYDPEEAATGNPLSIVDAIFVASSFDFSIDSAFSEAAAKAESLTPAGKYVWEAIRSAGRGKCLATAEQYGMNGPFSAMMGE